MCSAILMVCHLFPLILVWYFPPDHMSSVHPQAKGSSKIIVIMMAISLEILICVIVRHQ